MDEFINQLETFKSAFDFLSRSRIEIGILDGDLYKTVTISISDEESVDISAFDMLYLIEYGTLTFPPRKILEFTVEQLKSIFQTEFEKITTNILERDWTENEIRHELSRFEVTLNNRLPQIFHSYADYIQFLETNTNPENILQKVSISQFSDLVKCKIYYR